MTAGIVPDHDTPSGRAYRAHLAAMRRRRLRPATVRMRQKVIGLLNAGLGSVALLDATERDLERWVDSLSAMAIESVRGYVIGARQFYRWAHAQGLVADDPTRNLVPPRVPPALPRPISEPDLELALATAAGSLRAWLVLGAFAGLRAGEIATLRRDDVFDNLARPLLRVVDGKGGRQRLVPASPFVLAELAPHLQTRGRLWLTTYTHPDKRVSSLVGTHLHQLGIAASCHSLRHRFATVTYRTSRDLRMVQGLLGHQSPNTTAIYAAWDNEVAGTVVDGLPSFPPTLLPANAS